MNDNGVWLAVGLIPYRIELRTDSSGLRSLEVRALYWSLVVLQQLNRRTEWILCVPLVERLRDAFWAAVMQLRDRD